MLPPHAQSKLPILPAVSPRLVLRQHGAPFRLRDPARNTDAGFPRPH